MHFKHDNKEDEKQSLLHNFASFHYVRTIYVRNKKTKKREKDVFSKVNIYHDKLYEDKKKHQQTKAVPVRTKKEKFSYDMEAEKKHWTKKYDCINERRRKKS